jgi:hypothetical protein
MAAKRRTKPAPHRIEGKASKRRRGSATPKRRRSVFGRRGVAEVFQSLSGDTFAQAIQALLEAELTRIGIGLDKLQEVLTNTSKADGGIDAYIAVSPTSTSGFLGKQPEVFQFKRSCPSPTDLLKELKTQQRARERLKSGDGYVLVVGADLTDATERCSEIGRLIKELEPNVGDVRLFHAGSLKLWFRRHPSCWHHIPSLRSAADHLIPWSDWANSPQQHVADFPWTADEARNTAIQTLIGRVRQGEHVHVSGAPGVGKTRLVLEALRDMRGSVVYSGQYHQSLNALGQARDLFGALVVDECTPEQAANLVRVIGNSGLIIVTIGASNFRRASHGPNVIWLEPLPAAEQAQLAECVVSSTVPSEQRRELARRSGGYPKLIRLLIRAREYSPESLGTDWNDAAVRQLLVQFVAHGETERIFWVLALPTLFGRAEFKELAIAGQVNEQDLGAAFSRLEDLALIGTVGDRHYITPQLVADWFSGLAWNGDSNGLLTLLVNHCSPSLLRRCIDRLGDPQFLPVLERLNLDTLVSSLPGAAVAKLASTLAESGLPLRALPLLRKLLPPNLEWPRDSGHAFALRHVAWFDETFFEAAILLAEFVAATDLRAVDYCLIDLFGTHLGTTQADGAQRIEVLARLARHNSTSVRALACRGARLACSIEGGPISNGLPAPLRTNWRPQSLKEERTYRSAAARVLIELMGDDSDEVNSIARSSALSIIRSLVRSELPGIAATVVEAWASLRLPLAPIRSATEVVQRFDQAQFQAVPAPEVAQYNDAVALLTPTTLLDRLEEAVRQLAVGETPPQLGPLALELMKSPELPRILEWLVGDEAVPAFALGDACARHDTNHELVHELGRLAPTASSHRFTAGYIHGMGTDADTVLEGWSQSSELHQVIFEAIRHGPSTNAREALLERLVTAGAYSSKDLAGLVFGGWIVRLELPAAISLIRACARYPRAAFALAFQLERFTKPSRQDLFELLAETWSALRPEHIGQVHAAWEWGETAKRLLAQPEPVTTAAIRAMVTLEEPADEVAQVLRRVLGEHGRSSWRVVLDILNSAALRALSRVFGALRGMSIDMDSLSALIDWARDSSDRQVALSIVVTARTLPAVGGALLEAFLENRAFCEQMVSSVWSGSGATPKDIYAPIINALTQLEETASPKVRRWSKPLKKNLEEMMRRENEQEAAFEAGAIPFLYGWDR